MGISEVWLDTYNEGYINQFQSEPIYPLKNSLAAAEALRLKISSPRTSLIFLPPSEKNYTNSSKSGFKFESIGSFPKYIMSCGFLEFSGAFLKIYHTNR